MLHPLPPKPMTNHSGRKASKSQKTTMASAHNNKNQEQQVSKKSKVSEGSNAMVPVSSGGQTTTEDGSSYFARVSLDVFFQIASRLLAGDVLSLAQTSKSLRKILMSRSSVGIWRATISNVRGLPSCPPTISEPGYTALVFTLVCTTCGEDKDTLASTVSLVRLCGACRKTYGMPYRDIHSEIRFLFPPSASFVLRSKIDDETHLFQQIKASGDSERLEAWKKDKTKEASERRKFISQLERFMSQQRADRYKQEQEVKALALRERHAEIKKRLKELGWSEEDMVFPESKKRQWLAHLSHNTPLTDKHWNKIKPSLIKMLEANHCDARCAHLKTLWDAIKVDLASPTDPVTVSQSLVEAGLAVSRLMPVPEFLDVVEWPIMKRLVKPNVSFSEMGPKLTQGRAQLDQEILKWGNSIKESLAGSLRQGLDESGYTLDSPIVGTMANSSPTDPFEEISLEMQLLLRADSIFVPHSYTCQSESPVLYYDTFICSIRQHFNRSGELDLKKPLNTIHFECHPIAPGIARALLKCLGRPTNLSILELRALDERFVCGRCSDNKPKSWLGMVQHYIEQANIWKKAEARKSWFTKHRITMHNIHDIQADLPKPLVRLLTPEERTIMENAQESPKIEEAKDDDLGYALMCGPCLRSFIYMKITTRPRLIQHLRDVHEIIEPLLDDPDADLPEVKNHNFQTIYKMHLEDGEYEHDDFGDDPWWNDTEDEGEE